MIAIFSDLHLGIDDKEAATQAFYNQLKKLSDTNIKQLWLLGDIYDLFIGTYKFWKTSHKEFFEILAFYQSKNIQVVWVEGNHDFHLEKLFTPYGVSYKTEDFTTEVGGLKVYAGHGDTVNQEDAAYLKWRKTIKSKSFRAGLSMIPNFLAQKIFLPIACKASKQSRSRGEARETDSINSKYDDFALELINGQQYQAVILGHHHKKILLETENGFYLNLGCWSNSKGRYALWTPGQKPEIKEISF